MILGGRHKCMTPKLVGIRWFHPPPPPDFRGDLEHIEYWILGGGGGLQFSSAYIL